MWDFFCIWWCLSVKFFSLIFTTIYYKTWLFTWYLNIVITLMPPHASWVNWSKIFSTLSYIMKLIDPIILNFRKFPCISCDKAGRVWLLADPVSPFIIIRGQKYFYQNHCLLKTFTSNKSQDLSDNFWNFFLWLLCWCISISRYII